MQYVINPKRRSNKGVRGESAVLGKVWGWVRQHTEVLSVIVGGVLLSLVMNWPLVTRMNTALPGDLNDPLNQAWDLAWPRHALLNENAHLWNGNIYAGEPDAYAYADTMLGLAPLSFLFGSGISAALTHYNVVFLLSAALTSIGGYALLRQLGAHWSGCALAGVALAYSPWILDHDVHLNILFAGVFFLALFALARGHGLTLDGDPERSRIRPGWALTGWLLACWQLSTGFTMGISIAYFLACAAIVAIIVWLVRGRPRVPRKLMYANGVGTVAYLLTAAFMVRPYLRILERHPDAVDDRRFWRGELSPPLEGLITAPEKSWLWGESHASLRESMFWPTEMSLLMGFGVLTLGVIGVVYSAWSWRVRLALIVGAVITGIFALGATFFEGTYTVHALANLPGWDTVRTPGRFIFWTVPLVVILAAGALTKAAQAISAHTQRPALRRALTLALVIPALVAVLEGVPQREYPTVPRPSESIVRAMQEAEGHVLFLGANAHAEKRSYTEANEHVAMFWSVEGFPTVLNGLSSFNPPSYTERQVAVKNFPDTDSIAYLRARGVSTVIVPRSGEGEQITARDASGLELSIETYPHAVVYTIPHGSQ